MSPKPPAPDDDDRIVEEIYDALDEGDAEKALARAKIALHELGDDPVLRFLAGQAYLELDRPDDAAKELRNAVALDPEDPEFRASLALALFRACRFAEARPEAKAALEADPDLPDALNIAALLDERDGDFAAADAKLARATELDPERFPPPVRLARSEFEEVVVAAGEMLPEHFRSHLAEVATTVEDVPSEAVLTEDVPFDNDPSNSASLIEHLRRSFHYTVNNLGPHGLPLIGRVPLQARARRSRRVPAPSGEEGGER